MPKKLRSEKINSTIVVAIIGAVGTVVAAILASPVLIALIEKQFHQTDQKTTTIAVSMVSMDITDFYAASGVMGDMQNLEINDSYKMNCHSVPTCIQIRWKKGQIGWAGTTWQYPPENWGEKPGCNLTGANEVVFWAKGEQGGEGIKFEVASVQNGKMPVRSGVTVLTNEWQEYRIDVSDRDLSSVVGAFTWIADSTLNPKGVTFYLDDIQYVGSSSTSWSCP